MHYLIKFPNYVSKVNHLKTILNLLCEVEAVETRL